MPHDLTEFTPADEKYLREMDKAFEQELDYRALLEERNEILKLSATRWCTEAKQESYRADQAELREKRNRGAFLKATGFVALETLVLIGIGIYWWLKK